MMRRLLPGAITTITMPSLCPISLIIISIHLFLFSVSSSSTAAVASAKKPLVTKKLQSNEMEPSELETLFKIMETMSSDQNWRSSRPNPCNPSSSWLGIECKPQIDGYLHVTRLDFGSSPNPKCKLSATFPSLIFHLPYLQSAFFFQCFTRTKTTISVPKNRVLLNSSYSSSLQQLSLRSNPALVGQIPTQISSLKSLQILTLSQNRLSGPIPPEICTMTSLLHLDLSYNLLGGAVPNQLGNLKNLLGLDLSYNMLMGPIPDTIGQLGMLQKIDLSSNSLAGKIPASIENLDSLIFMAMSNNKLHGTFPKGLARLQSLQYLIMDDNPMFTALPLEFGQLQRLQELRLANSGYSGTIPATICQLMNLGTLSLQNNRLTGEIPVGFTNLSRIYHLNLSRNFLGGVVPFSPSFLDRLGKNLDLSGNPGLCLNPSEANNGVKIGVNICGVNKSSTGSVIQTLKKSRAAPTQSGRTFLLIGSLVGALATTTLLHLNFFLINMSF